MIDIGVNLTNCRFDSDRDAVLLRAQQSGVQHIVVTGTSLIESEKAITLCKKNPTFLSCTAGIHPHDADNAPENFIEHLSEFASNNEVKAIGECGLDFNRNFSSPENQVSVFKKQIELAAQLSLPLFLHQRDAFEPWFACLKPYINKIPALIAHCFTGSEPQLKTCVQAGMYIGITGWVCDERRGKNLANILHHIPVNRLLLETDAPYLIPRNIRPKPKSSRNEPSYLAHVAEFVAAQLSIPCEQLKAQCSQNAIKAFNLISSPVLLTQDGGHA